MNDHMYVHGLWDQLHKCIYCAYSTATKANVLKHEMTMHIDPIRRDYECKYYSKSFKTSSNMYVHMRVMIQRESFIVSFVVSYLSRWQGIVNT